MVDYWLIDRDDKVVAFQKKARALIERIDEVEDAILAPARKAAAQASAGLRRQLAAAKRGEKQAAKAAERRLRANELSKARRELRKAGGIPVASRMDYQALRTWGQKNLVKTLRSLFPKDQVTDKALEGCYSEASRPAHEPARASVPGVVIGSWGQNDFGARVFIAFRESGGEPIGACITWRGDFGFANEAEAVVLGKPVEFTEFTETLYGGDQPKAPFRTWVKALKAVA